MFNLINKNYKQLKSDLLEDSKVKSVINKLGKNFIDLDFNDPIEMLKAINNIEGKLGLYYFEVKQISNRKSWDDLRDAWPSVNKTSPIIDKNWKKHQFTLNEFYPFYIGKSVNGFSNRVSQHVFATKKNNPNEFLKSTSALRLKQHYEASSDILKCFEFRVYTVELELEPDLLPFIESEVRNRKFCIAGVDRT